MNFNFKISGRDFCMGMGGIIIGTVVVLIPSLKRINSLSEKNEELANGLEGFKLKNEDLEKDLNDSEEKRAKLIVENRHKDDEIKYLRDENQFYRGNYNKTSDAIL